MLELGKDRVIGTFTWGFNNKTPTHESKITFDEGKMPSSEAIRIIKDPTIPENPYKSYEFWQE